MSSDATALITTDDVQLFYETPRDVKHRRHRRLQQRDSDAPDDVAPKIDTGTTLTTCTASSAAALRRRLELDLRRELRPLVESQLRDELQEQHIKRVSSIYAAVHDAERRRAERRWHTLCDAWSRLYDTSEYDDDDDDKQSKGDVQP